MSFAAEKARAAEHVFSRLGEPATFRRRNAVADVPVTVILRRSVQRQGESGEPFVQAEIAGKSTELGTLQRGDRFALNGERWLVDAPSRNTGTLVAAFVVPEIV